MALPPGVKTFAELYYKATFDYNDDNIAVIRKFGTTGTIAADQKVDIWPYESNRVNLSAAETLSFVSSSTQDSSAGTGSGAVYINGLANDYSPIAEVVFLNGTTPVVTTKEFLRVNSMVALDFIDPVAPNAGRILATASTAGTVQGIIEAGFGVDESAYFTVPLGYTAYAITRQANVERGSGNGRRAGVFKSKTTIPGQVVTEVTIYSLATDGTGHAETKFEMPSGLPEKTDISLSITAETNGTEATILTEYLLLKGAWTKPENPIYEL